MSRLLGVLEERDDARFLRETEATVQELVGADEVHVVPFDTFAGAPPYLVSFGRERRYHGPLLSAARACMLEGGYIDTELLTGRQRDRMPLYAEVLEPLGLRSQMVHLVRFRGQTIGVVHANRFGARGSRFREGALRRLRVAMQVLGTALVARRQPAAPTRVTLAPREAEVASLAVRGFENAQIAAHLGTSANTVRNQLHAVFRKLGVYSRLELATLLLGRSDVVIDPKVLVARNLLHDFRVDVP